MRHPWQGEQRCDAAEHYVRVELPHRRAMQANTLPSLTGWDLMAIRNKMHLATAGNEPEVPWWEALWN